MLNRENKKQRPNRKAHLRTSGTILTVILILSLGLTYLLIESLSPNTVITINTEIIIVVSITFMFVGIAYCVLSSSEALKKLLYRVKQRESLIKLTMSLCFGILITASVNVTAVSISKAQFELSNHSTLPSFKLNCIPTNSSIELVLSSEVGSASHISATIKDHCYFRYKDTPCELDIDQPTTICSGSGSIDSQERSVSFKPEGSYTNPSNARKMIEAAVLERFPDAEYISVERYIVITFFDYQNQLATYRFSEHDGQIKLISTNSSLVAKNNRRGMVFDDIVPYKETVGNVAKDLLESFTTVDEQDAYFWND